MEWFKKHKVLSAAVVVVVTVAISAVAGWGIGKNASQQSTQGSSQSSSATASSNKSSTATGGRIGEGVRDGKFEFTIKSMGCGKSEIVSPEDDYLRKSPQGQYCVVAISVKNIGNQQQAFDPLSQILLDSANNRYGRDERATTYANTASAQSSWSQINPGNGVEAKVVFDVPKGVTPKVAELHDSADSSGVKVSLP